MLCMFLIVVFLKIKSEELEQEKKIEEAAKKIERLISFKINSVDVPVCICKIFMYNVSLDYRKVSK